LSYSGLQISKMKVKCGGLSPPSAGNHSCRTFTEPQSSGTPLVVNLTTLIRDCNQTTKKVYCTFFTTREMEFLFV